MAAVRDLSGAVLVHHQEGKPPRPFNAWQYQPGSSTWACPMDVHPQVGDRIETPEGDRKVTDYRFERNSMVIEVG